MGTQILHVRAPAKVNLYLDVLGKRRDGYHEIRTVMQSLSLSDQLTIAAVKDDNTEKDVIRLGVNQHKINENLSEVGEKNLVVQAVQMLRAHYHIPPVEIILDKRIPIAAGLGGGSADAAAALRGINQLFHLDISHAHMEWMAAQLGLDVPFCLKGGTVLAQGKGEQLTPLTPLSHCTFLLVQPNVTIHTGTVYQGLNLPRENTFLSTSNDEAQFNQLISGIDKGDLYQMAAGMYNRMEEVIFNWYKALAGIKAEINKAGALKSLMSGSGAVIYGIFDNLEYAQQAQKILNRHNHKTYLAFPDRGEVKNGNGV